MNSKSAIAQIGVNAEIYSSKNINPSQLLNQEI